MTNKINTLNLSMSDEVDIRENNIFKLYPGILEMLLKEHTTQKNIFWATDSYASLGKGYQYNDPIAIASITGKNGMLLRPRAVKYYESKNQDLPPIVSEWVKIVSNQNEFSDIRNAYINA